MDKNNPPKPTKRSVLTDLMVKYGAFKNKIKADKDKDWKKLTAG